MNENPGYTNGVILEKVGGWKGRRNFIFEFVVDGIKYRDGNLYNPERDIFELGDSCRVLYDKADPSNNAVLKDENKRCIIFKPGQ